MKWKHLNGLLASSFFILLVACNNGGGTPAPTAPAAPVDTDLPKISLGTTSNTVNLEGGIIILTAVAEDNVGVSRVEFFEGAVKISEDLTAPYNHSISFSIANNGNKVYTARAFDEAGNKADSLPVTVAVNIAPPDTTPPTIVSVSPASNASGVQAATNIVITFSEPMDKLLTQSAYQSATAGVLPSQVQFSWNTEGTVLTVDPNADLIYDQGTNPATATARQYSYQLTNVATDLAGNPIVPASYSFTTSRRIFQALPPLGALSGNVDAGGGVNTASGCTAGEPCTGDSTANTQVRGFVSYDMSALPAGVQTFEAANLNMNQTGGSGSPFATLGSVQLEHVNFATLDSASAFNATALLALGTISSDGTATVKSRSVLAAVQDDYANRAARGNRTQYRLSFATATDTDGTPDVVRFAAPTAGIPSALSVTYLLP